MYVCSCFGITEQQVRQHAETGACTPRQIAGACKAGTDCGSCVRKIQSLLGRGACPRREALDPVVLTTATATTSAATAVAATSVPAPTAAEAA
ncbi:bacterioferritin-associated ferredoxin [Streptomyces antimycoticus]|uniref:Bacterioferritin-associated ferredoxin n=2 Tax=Streptomyces violaceusniger group TaxID=2839105 RepID=A0ABD5JFE4_9ACTN|nr:MULTISPECIES: (2Fe-2S)-binding protein [Streptomyces]MEE4587130.1 (2Fe-2S)-binding protein [Streptomyces sp. DSM 41602]AJZ87229.2 (2Fe-2S)-binding protein [Streptomyces sp. AgN23]KUL63654.1 (2Fe-2S)-binding protein [Streptomyces violaceusniger]RSS48149.1 (2Fe-2S)-binding protein [Streptomyces sp. WAC05858]WJE00122.1 (2Fe-2S)-binding protein [Streptomyces antimycoticus]